MAKKDNDLFVVDNSFEANPVDWYNSHIEVDFKLLKLDRDQAGAGITAGTGNVNTFCITTNAHSFMREMQVECNRITVDNNTRADESLNVLSLLNYTKEYADSVAKENLFYLDTSTRTAEPRTGKPLFDKGFSLLKNFNRCC